MAIATLWWNNFCKTHTEWRNSWGKIHYKNGSSILFTTLNPLWSLAISKMKKIPGQNKCIPTYAATVDHNTERYTEKQLPRMFSVMAPSNHKLHSYTREILWMWEQLALCNQFWFAKGYSEKHMTEQRK